VRDRIANDVEPLAATECVTPTLGVKTLGILAKKKVVSPHLVTTVDRWAHDRRGAPTVELVFWASPTPWALQLHHFVLRSLVGDAGGSRFIDQTSGVKTRELKRYGEFMILAGGQHVREGPSTNWNRFETARTPATIDVQAGNRGGTDDGTRILDDVNNARPMTQHPQTA
jgi:hypothetical protein